MEFMINTFKKTNHPELSRQRHCLIKLPPRELGVERQVITNSLAGRQQLTGEQALALQEFLQRHQ
jgi:hypothetical protein